MYDSLKGDELVPEESYFSVRLVEMRLAESGNYVADYLPMCSCFLRYTYGGAQREVPFVISVTTPPYSQTRHLSSSPPP